MFFVHKETNILYYKQYCIFSSLFIWQNFLFVHSYVHRLCSSMLTINFRLCSIFRPFPEDQPMSRLQLEYRPMSRLDPEGRPMSRRHMMDRPMNGLHLADQPMRSLLAERRGHLDWDRSGRGNGHGTITTISLSTLHIGESNYFFVHGLIHF